MARLKVKVSDSDVGLIASPSELVLTDYGSFIKVSTRFERHGYTLAQPLSEAVEELNAAMDYNRYEEAAFQGAKLRQDFIDEKKEETK